VESSEMPVLLEEARCLKVKFNWRSFKFTHSGIYLYMKFEFCQQWQVKIY